MEFKTTRASAIENLDNFIKNNLGEYSKLRNFDFGPNKRSNTSCLSPYITHGLINLQSGWPISARTSSISAIRII